MLAFEMSVNGKVLYVAGLEDGRPMISTEIEAIVHPRLQKRMLQVDTRAPKLAEGASDMVSWGSQDLEIGDVVTIRILASERADRPRLQEASATGSELVESEIGN